MLTIVHKLLDFIFPPRATERCVRALSSEQVHARLTPGTYESTRYLLPYQHELIRSLIQENKYYGNERAAKLLAEVLALWLKQHTQGNTVLIPIPLSAARKKARGYNQVERILQRLPVTTNTTIAAGLIARTKNTPPQTTLQKQERLNNMKGAFAYREDRSLAENSTFIIIDDVVTTGATLVAARAALAPHLPPTTKIICLALAH